MNRFTFFLFAALATVVAQAGTVVQFDAFPTGDFTSGTNNGFTVNASLGYIWGNTFGFPGNSAGVPSPNTLSTYTFTDGGSFNFLSIDIDNPDPNASAFPAIIVDGYLGATLVAEDTFTVPNIGQTPATFLALNLAGLNIDSLVVSVTSSPGWSPLIDNVAFASAVPEPAAMAMLGIGVCALWGFKRLSRRLS